MILEKIAIWIFLKDLSFPNCYFIKIFIQAITVELKKVICLTPSQLAQILGLCRLFRKRLVFLREVK
jgi:hypothetical protein